MESVAELNKEKIPDYLKGHNIKLQTLGVYAFHLFRFIAYFIIS
jgi:hypothetical protein